MKRIDENELLDKVIDSIRTEQIDSASASAAADRVWARISAANAGDANARGVNVEQIQSCGDFQSLIPAYLRGNLSEARSLLLVDHTHECIPCRKAMNEARKQKRGIHQAPVKRNRYSLQPVVLRWGIAAALVIGFGLLALPFIQNYLPFGTRLEATVQAAEGQVYEVAETATVSVGTGSKLNAGERIRTAKDARAVVALGDGSSIEMKDRSELYLTRNREGTTIHLSRGSIVVEAAKQRSQKLFVETNDSLVSVVGTVFSVNNGTKGSRVSVIEGEVHLNHAGNNRVLKPGQQVTTSPAIEVIPVKQEVAWSRKADKYAQMLSSLAALNSELNAVARPGVRNSTHLLDLMPDSTVVYAALPNLANTISESHRIIQQRIEQNPALREWWAKEHSGAGQNMSEVMDTIRQFGEYLGDEIAVSVSIDEKGEPAAPLVLAELKDAAAFRQFLEQQIAKHSSGQHGKPHIEFVDDPSSASGSFTTNDEMFVWIQNNLLVASPKLGQLQSVAKLRADGGNSSFATSPFRDRIASIYQEGAGLIVAADLERVVSQTKSQRTATTDAQKHEAALNKLGLLNVKYFVLDQKETDGKTHTQASLSFNEPQRGVASWLAAPGPMGSLEYISPDANFVTGFVVKNPVALVDDLLGALETVSPELRKMLDTQQTAHGFDIRNDIAAPLGGEFAFAIDGPILPTPSWKLVFEVNDPSHLQQTLERVVGEVNKEVARFGKSGLAWDQADIGGRVYYTLKSSDIGLEVNFTYANGYMIVAPTRALVERALQSHDSGVSLLKSSNFTAGLPADGNANFSALFYHNLAPLVQPFANTIANTANGLPSGPQQAVKALAADMPPTLAYAYAQGDTITFAANTEGGPFGLSPATIFGMPNALEMQNLIQRGMRDGK
jgi:ferric-dicitrate binding protein FerR (iron transport regulator)